MYPAGQQGLDMHSRGAGLWVPWGMFLGVTYISGAHHVYVPVYVHVQCWLCIPVCMHVYVWILTVSMCIHFRVCVCVYACVPMCVVLAVCSRACVCSGCAFLCVCSAGCVYLCVCMYTCVYGADCILVHGHGEALDSRPQ